MVSSAGHSSVGNPTTTTNNNNVQPRRRAAMGGKVFSKGERGAPPKAASKLEVMSEKKSKLKSARSKFQNFKQAKPTKGMRAMSMKFFSAQKPKPKESQPFKDMSQPPLPPSLAQRREASMKTIDMGEMSRDSVNTQYFDGLESMLVEQSGDDMRDSTSSYATTATEKRQSALEPFKLKLDADDNPIAYEKEKDPRLFEYNNNTVRDVLGGAEIMDKTEAHQLDEDTRQAQRPELRANEAKPSVWKNIGNFFKGAAISAFVLAGGKVR